MSKQILILFTTFFVTVGQSQAINLTFRVNMRGNPISVSGVHVAGNFQSEAGFGADWMPGATQMTDADADKIFEITVNVPAGAYEFKFLNGISWPTAETNLVACGVGSDYNRVVMLSSADSVLPVVAFNACNAPNSNYSTHWWNDAVFYEVFVRSFYDNNGDGKGDFAGLTAKLDYLNDGDPNTTTDLGITGIWLMPINPSPSYHGYDVTDYKGIESDYGTMAQFDAFLVAAHQRGIKVIIDLVLNHTSSQHPWFTQSAANTTNTFRDWYVWSPTNPGYQGPWGQPSVWAQNRGTYYYNLFWSGMPDLNWNKPEVKTAMWDAVQFWLNKGVDGYRLDAVKYLIEDSLQSASQVKFENTAGTYSVLQEFHNVVRAAKPDAFTIGEVWSPTAQVVPYVTENRLDACFEFAQSDAILATLRTGNPSGLRNQLLFVDQTFPKLQYGTFLTNHDQERVFSTLAGNTAKMKQAASLYLTLPGVPFLYYGEEIGMLGTGPDEDKRKPMQWSAAANGGFTTGTPWRTPNSNFAQFNVASQQADPASLLNHYKTLIRLRTSQQPLLKGYYVPATSSSQSVLSYGRIYGDSGVLVVANVGSTATRPELSVSVSSLSPGLYYLSDLYTGQGAGTLTIDSLGGFTNWTATLPALEANHTWILRLAGTQAPVAIRKVAPIFTPTLTPNPASNQVRIDLGLNPSTKSQVTVYDLTGQLQQVSAFSGSSTILFTHNWPNGSYFLRIKSGSKVDVQRLVVAH